MRRARLRYVFVLGICWMMIPLVGSQIFFGVLRATGASLGLFPCEDETFAKATDIVHERCVRRPPPPRTHTAPPPLLPAGATILR